MADIKVVHRSIWTPYVTSVPKGTFRTPSDVLGALLDNSGTLCATKFGTPAHVEYYNPAKTVNLRGHEEGNGLDGEEEHYVVHEAQQTCIHTDYYTIPFTYNRFYHQRQIM